jgi:membrane protease YdiL (CAAX protease family)
MTWFDHLFALTLLLGLPAYAAWHVSRLARRVEADAADARVRDYILTIVLQWSLTLTLVGWWVYAGRPFVDIGLATPKGSGRLWTIVLTAAAVTFFASQARAVAQSAVAQGKIRAQLDSQPGVRVILPTTPREMRTFGALAVTAGICEEILYRGYLLYYLRAWLPGAAAVAAAVAVFGVAHVYQGRRGILLTGIAGAAAMGLYLLTGSLAAPIFLHITIDVANGFMAYRVLTSPVAPPV